MAGIGNAWNYGQYDNFEIRPVARGVPVISTPELAPVTGPPAAPALFVPTPLNQSVRLSWSPVKGATSYRIRYGTQKGEYRSQVDAGTPDVLQNHDADERDYLLFCRRGRE